MHANTKLTPYTRGRMIQDRQEGMSVKDLCDSYGVSRTIFYRFWGRFLQAGAAGLTNRSCRPRRVRCALTDEQVEQIVVLRHQKAVGPARISYLVGMPTATIYRCLRRQGLARLPKPPRPPVVRYEAKAPGELIHLDVLHLFALKGQKPAYQFTLVDDYTRMAYATISPRRTTQAAIQAVREAQDALGFSFQRILTDNDVTFSWTYRPGFRWNPPPGSHRFTATLRSWGIAHKLTRIRRPQTNGKVERFHRTIKEELYRPHPLFVSDELTRLDSGHSSEAIEARIAHDGEDR